MAPVGGEPPECLGDVAPARQAQAADGEVAQAGHRLRPMAGADLGAVFIKHHIALPVQAVFNLPLTTCQFSDSDRVCLVR